MKKPLLLIIALLAITFTNAQTIGATFTDVNGYEYEVTSASPNEVKVIGYTATDLDIPASINDGTYDYDITLLPSGVFKADLTITSITSTAEAAIALQAFNGCTNLVTVNLPNAISIGNSAFLNCSKLETANIASVTGSLGNSTFKGCPVLADINASSATSTGNNTFQNSGPFTTTDFSSLTTLGSQSFRNASMTSISLPALTDLGDADAHVGLVFWQCSNLETISMPVVESIAVGAFNSCTSLTSITLPSTVAVLDQTNYNMFKGCTSLTNVTIEYNTTIPLSYNPAFVGGDAAANSSIFDDITLSGVTLTIPAAATSSDYSTGDVWKDFGTLVVEAALSIDAVEESGISAYPNPVVNTLNIVSEEVVSVDVYTISGANIGHQEIVGSVDMSNLTTGIYFVKCNDVNGATISTIKVVKK